MITTLTFDLDDTLWSTHEVIGRAEQILFDYLRTHCPAFVEQHSVQSFAKMRQGLIAMDPARAHNLRRLRRDALAIEFQRLGQPNADALADQASQIFQTARQQVNFWPGILEALAELRAWERSGRRRTPVIMVTAYDLPEDRRRMLDAGADGYVAKPLDAERLRAELQRVLG